MIPAKLFIFQAFLLSIPRVNIFTKGRTCYTFYMYKRTYIRTCFLVAEMWWLRVNLWSSSQFMEPVVCFMNISGYAILGCELKWKIWNHVSCTKMFWIGFCHPIFPTAGLVNN